MTNPSKQAPNDFTDDTAPSVSRPPVDPPLSVERDELLRYIELDLWSRFQTRLWTLLGAFLTVVSLAGFLGVPCYMRSEINARLAAQQEEFRRRSEEVLQFAKLLVTVTSENHPHNQTFGSLRIRSLLPYSSIPVLIQESYGWTSTRVRGGFLRNECSGPTQGAMG